MTSQNVAWFPIVFPDRCDGCAGFEQPKCVDFCPNDVLDIVDGKAVTVKPQNCVFGCSSCELLCHRKAIIFPERSGESSLVPRKEKGLLRKATCPECSKVFWTSRNIDLCFDCER